MSNANAAERKEILQNLPSVDEVLRTEAGQRYAESEGPAAATANARAALDDLRRRFGRSSDQHVKREDLLSAVEADLARRLIHEQASGLRRIINATGVVIHTNLGRAPLSEDAKAAILQAGDNCTLEYDLETGKRGRRGGRVERLVAELTGAEDAAVVNNGAAAAFLVLTALVSGGEVVISRGELVEIGSDFRIPDVLETSGAVLREIGTTNRTKLADYARAITAETRMILRVHPSNFRIVGFTASPSRKELVTLAKESGVVFYEDLGSGALVDLSQVGLTDEPMIADAVAAGVHLVSFSGDKLLGGPQAGIVVGRKELVDKIRKHPLYRVLRLDKLAYAGLEATLQSYRRGEMFETVPVLRQLAASAQEIRSRAEKLVDALYDLTSVNLEIIDGTSAVGGGAAPATAIATYLIGLSNEKLSANEMESRLRMSNVPLIARIENDQVVLDLRTVLPEDEELLQQAIRQLDA
ncbi:MAG: L-seryl-tRNA(Sec) selenium transferase [Pyrinomonadaceae bacterium]